MVEAMGKSPSNSEVRYNKAGGQRQPAEVFWRNVFSGVSLPISLPIRQTQDLDLKAIPQSTEHAIPVSESVACGIRALAQEHHVSPEAILWGAWAILLSRYSGEQAVIFGAAGTLQVSPAEHEDPCDPIPLRMHIAEDEPVLSWLRTVDAQLAELRQHWPTPLKKIREWCDLPAERPLFESLVAISTSPPTPHSELAVTMPMLVTVVWADNMVLRLRYRQDLFDAGTMIRLLGHYQRLLEGMAAEPERRISTLELLTAAERRQLLVEWNQT
ncbi:MAG: condensation domain-containing protein, partial [Bacillota bacterium]